MIPKGRTDMATLSRSEARTHRAKKHAHYSHTCPLCGKVCWGNGGWSSHKAKHLRDAGLPSGDFEIPLVINDVAFDENRAIIPNEGGRVTR